MTGSCMPHPKSFTHTDSTLRSLLPDQRSCAHFTDGETEAQRVDSRIAGLLRDDAGVGAQAVQLQAPLHSRVHPDHSTLGHPLSQPPSSELSPFTLPLTRRSGMKNGFISSPCLGQNVGLPTKPSRPMAQKATGLGFLQFYWGSCQLHFPP